MSRRRRRASGPGPRDRGPQPPAEGARAARPTEAARRKRPAAGDRADRPAASARAARPPQGSRARADASAPQRSGWSLRVQLAVLAGVFATVAVVAELLGAANLGVALGVGQVVFAIVVVWVLARR